MFEDLDMSLTPLKTINMKYKDAKNVKEFVKCFRLEAPDAIAACDYILKHGCVNLITQNRLTLGMCKMMTGNAPENAMFKDPLWADIRKRAQEKLDWWENNATPEQKRWEVAP